MRGRLGPISEGCSTVRLEYGSKDEAAFRVIITYTDERGSELGKLGLARQTNVRARLVKSTRRGR